MNELKIKQNQIKKLLLLDYNIRLSIKDFERYLFLFSKWVQKEQIKMHEAVDMILENPTNFAYFIYGSRSEQVKYIKN